MKKWLAGLFAVVLFFAGTAYADECAHETTVKRTKTTDEMYAETDNETHLHTFTITIQTYCQKCRTVIKESVGGPFEAVERHFWTSEGSCLQCGKKNTCQHTNTEELRINRGTTATDLGDGLHHHVVEEVEINSYCSDCGIRIGDSRTEVQEYDEAHTLKYGCWDCDYKAVCPHEGETYENIDWTDSRYEKLDEDTHAIYGKTKTTVYCRDCEEKLSTAESETEQLLDTESHHWYNNTCWSCGFERTPVVCEHSDTVVKLKEVYDQYYECVEVNSTSHEKTIVYAEINCCTDCGKEIGEILSFKKVIRIEDHNYSTVYHYICEGCGYVNTCAHDEATHTVVKKGDWWDAISIDENTHKVDCVACRYTYCDQCGARFSEEQLGRQWLVEVHEMDGDECIWCDYRIACPHENTIKKLKQSSDYLYCNSISNNAHSAAYQLYQYDYCEDCGTLLENYDGTYAGVEKVNEPHNMVNHRCVECGYCEHPVEQIETTYESRGQREYIEQNAYLHKSFIWYDYTSVCKLCGNTVETWSQQGKNLTEEHYYDEQGICRKCGYVNECLHENGYRVPLGYYMYRYENIGDENQHQLSEWLASEMFCPDCLMSWDHQTEEEPVVSMEEHRIGNAGGASNVCADCGYVFDTVPEPCLHEHTEKWIYYGERLSGYEYIDEDYHAVYGTDLYEAIDCHDCHYTISETLVQEGRVLREANEVHIFDRNGVCRCGYVNPCKHENTVIDATGTDGIYVLQVDDTHHERVSIMKKSVHCADCGIWLSNIEQREERSLYEEHYFNKFGVCHACNYVNGCKHEQTQVNYNYGLTSCYAIDNAQHEITETIQKREECLTCGEVIGKEFVEEVTEKQNHDGAEACSICGWKTAKHIHAWEQPGKQVCSATAIDALTHKTVTQIAGHYRCLECGYDGGQEIVLPAESVIEPHNFTDLGRCADCGYVNFCAHEETYEVQEPIFDPTYQIKDDLEHTYTASMHIETRCMTCDQRLSYTAALNAECTEEHVFDNVADLICDLCGYEKEAPEEAPTPEPTPTATPEPEESEKPDTTPKPTQKPGGGSGSTEKPGFYVTVKSDKKHYGPDETAKITITLRNTTGKRVENVRIEHLLPDGLLYAPEQDMSVFDPFTVEANTTVKRVVYVKVMGAGLPQTGDESNLMIWLALAVVSAAAVAVLRAKRMKG